MRSPGRRVDQLFSGIGVAALLVGAILTVACFSTVIGSFDASRPSRSETNAASALVFGLPAAVLLASGMWLTAQTRARRPAKDLGPGIPSTDPAVLPAVIGAAVGAVAAELLASAAALWMGFPWQVLAYTLIPVGPAVGTWIALRRRNVSGAALTALVVWVGFFLGVQRGQLWTNLFAPHRGLIAAPLVGALLAAATRGVSWLYERKRPERRLLFPKRERRNDILVAAIVIAGWALTFLPMYAFANMVTADWEKVRNSPMLLAPLDQRTCATALDDDCISKAAARARRPIAYLPVQPGYRLLGLFAPKGTGDQENGIPLAMEGMMAIQGPPFQIDVITYPSADALANRQQDGTHRKIDVDGVPVTVDIPGSPEDRWLLPFGQIAWEHGGRLIQISKSNMGLMGPSVTEDELMALYRQVRYAEPPPPTSVAASPQPHDGA